MADFNDPFADLLGDGLQIPDAKSKKHSRAHRSRSAQPLRSMRVTQKSDLPSAADWPPAVATPMKNKTGLANSNGSPLKAPPSQRPRQAPPLPSTAPPGGVPMPHLRSTVSKSHNPIPTREPTLSRSAKSTPQKINPEASPNLNNPFMKDEPNPFMKHRKKSSLFDDIDFSSALAQLSEPVAPKPPPSRSFMAIKEEKGEDGSEFGPQIKSLHVMGFTDNKQNFEALKKCDGNVNRAVDLLLKASPAPPIDFAPSKGKGKQKHKHKGKQKHKGRHSTRQKSPMVERTPQGKELAHSHTKASQLNKSESSLMNAMEDSRRRNQKPSMISTAVSDQGRLNLSSLSSLRGLSQGFTEPDSDLDGDPKIPEDTSGAKPYDFSTIFEDLFGTSQTAPQPEPVKRSKPWSAEETAKNKRTHRKVVQEIIATERSYCEGLQKLIKYFVYPLQGIPYTPPVLDRPRANSEGIGPSSGDAKSRRHSTISRWDAKTKGVIDRSEAVALFSNIELIYRLNKTFLENLESNSEDVGKTFHRFALYFKMYMPYVQNHDNANALLTELRKDKRAFRNAVATQEKESVSSLPSLLILPIQRIPRYKLLLETLIKHTHDTDPAYSGLTSALDLIRKVAVHINQSINAREDAKKLREIQALFSGNVELVAPHRRFIMRQAMKKVTKHSSLVPREFFLFSDMLLYGTDDVTFSEKLRLRQTMPIDKSFLVSEVHRYGESDHLLYVSSSVKNITISFENEADKEKWRAALTKCMEDRRKKIGFNYVRRGSQLLKQQNGQNLIQKVETGPIFTSYSYGTAAEEAAKTDPEFYKQMHSIDLTRKYFESLNRQTKEYFREQQALVKVSSQFAIKLKGETVGLSEMPWYRALDSTSSMVAVHSHEMLRWKSVSELLIDSITWLLKGPVAKAENKKNNYAKHANELQQAKKNLEAAKKKKKNEPKKLNAASEAMSATEREYKAAKAAAIQEVKAMNFAIRKGFVSKLKLFVQVQADFHKDCYHDIRQCWTQVNKVEQENADTNFGFSFPITEMSSGSLNSDANNSTRVARPESSDSKHVNTIGS
eukprot:CAMPEP_0184494088 /NCGR_PEP_ID=MMETSP0113_2-20130426/27738_1 /TAXON_ID=91329 /ORGANISM="Norrisiella sphaerica, Strain BC52" /LENGTH=1059 /DNA_ID=CAMNT_0026879653 /DNA_START=87 /DNA_END=3266 /DNA_ORIENTATION=-